MDPRRITLHLIRSVRGKKYNPEVDRVWEVTPGVFAQPITYVLECKWGLVTKRNVDDFLEVLRLMKMLIAKIECKTVQLKNWQKYWQKSQNRESKFGFMIKRFTLCLGSVQFPS